MNNLRVLLDVLEEHELFAKYRKCEFWLRSVTFLGHINSSKGVEVDPMQMEAVKSFPISLTSTDIRNLLGLAGYYCRFFDCFVSISSPLTTLTEKSKMFEWSEEFEKIFKTLKDSLTSALVLTIPEGTKGFVVYFDESQVSLG